MPNSSRATVGQRVWAVLATMQTMMLFVMLAILLPAMTYMTSFGTVDLLTYIPDGHQIWQVSYYVVPVVTLVLIIANALYRRNERRRPARDMARLRGNVTAMVRKRLAERDEQ